MVTTFIGGSYEFMDSAARLLDARAHVPLLRHGHYAGDDRGQARHRLCLCERGARLQGRYFEGAKTYKVTLPAPVPAGRFWSFTIYDNQTRSMLETDQATAGLDSTLPGLKKNADGSVTVWFSPKAPAGQEDNWVQTRPARAGTRSSGSTRRCSLGSTRAGSRAISSWCNERRCQRSKGRKSHS